MRTCGDGDGEPTSGRHCSGRTGTAAAAAAARRPRAAPGPRGGRLAAGGHARPATRAWLTGSDRPGAPLSAATPGRYPEDPAPAPAQADSREPGSAAGPWTPPAAGGAPVTQEPPLDPDAFASAPTSGSDDDPEVTRVADRARRGLRSDGAEEHAPAASATPTPAWEPPAQQEVPSWQPPARDAAPVQPSTPSWWIGRSTPAGSSTSDDQTGAPDTTGSDPVAATDQSSGTGTGRGAPGADEESASTDAERDRPAPVVSPPQPGDTAVVEPLVDRRPAPQRPAPQRPAPLVTPGSAGATCHVCGHALEPDDIFCGECGAVRPAVTAAFTGPIVPLPVARPDWAADGDDPRGRATRSHSTTSCSTTSSRPDRTRRAQRADPRRPRRTGHRPAGRRRRTAGRRSRC